MKRYLTSPSCVVTVGSAILCASPAYLTAIGLTTCAATAYAIWFSGSSIDTGTVLWRLSASDGKSEGLSFFAPILASCQLGVAASGAGASAMTAWDK